MVAFGKGRKITTGFRCVGSVAPRRLYPNLRRFIGGKWYV